METFLLTALAVVGSLSLFVFLPVEVTSYRGYDEHLTTF